jgi:hypothetical protein
MIDEADSTNAQTYYRSVQIKRKPSFQMVFFIVIM